MKLLREISRTDWQRPSVIALLLANLVPVFGVLFFDWEVFPLLLLFWSENVIIGVFNVFKMLVAGPNTALKFFLVPFFCVHYGMFTAVHGVFVLALFGGKMRGAMGFPTPALFWESIRENQLAWAVIGLAVSHGISFVTNFIQGGEYKRTNTPALMIQPYGRIFVLHLTIILGGGLMMLLRSPMAGLLLLVALKILLDLRAHLAERKKFAEPVATN